MLRLHPTLAIAAMLLDILDAEELFHVALSAMQQGRDGEALTCLKQLLKLHPDHPEALHLLGAQYAQLRMFGRAEATWTSLLVSHPEHAAARFQLGRLLLLKGDANAVANVLQPLAATTEDLGYYAAAVIAASQDNVGRTERALVQGLACPQSNPAVTDDMRQWLQRLREQAGTTSAPAAPHVQEPVPMLLSRYGQH
ncbi:tetratricopeptide repeat protein [Stenotrophomonas pavanii]|uniref:tetratricopeptide repeat protein n=1 Tax=Stenotrophomonas pavanii TaxID=487698 RepID=UPI0019D44D75|nr:tetratricopeptide repeat protein [Stenotrophomonas pavanii]MBN7836302.1 tetratricopeptide repeat protein [Stenotrophomonas maltophilia]MEC4339489.1 tetratricopeptide repeat protein [Stenotrophomonas pavanii]